MTDASFEKKSRRNRWQFGIVPSPPLSPPGSVRSQRECQRERETPKEEEEERANGATELGGGRPLGKGGP